MTLLCCDVGLFSELRLTAGCVLMDLAGPAVSGTFVYAFGLTNVSYKILSKMVEDSIQYQTSQAMQVKYDKEAGSCKHCCVEKKSVLI